MAPGVGWGISSPYAAKNRDQLGVQIVDDVTGEPEYYKDGSTKRPMLYSGTSFAAPLVAGLAAYFRGIADPNTRLCQDAGGAVLGGK